jgi:hypothetical protein
MAESTVAALAGVMVGGGKSSEGVAASGGIVPCWQSLAGMCLRMFRRELVQQGAQRPPCRR